MNFNFSDAVNSQNSGRQQLAGDMIHEVVFDGCEARDFESTQNPGQMFHVLEIKFSNKDGQFTHTIWQPKEEDFQDRQGAFGAQPSNVATMVYMFKHLLDAVNPEASEKINKGELKMEVNPNNWESVRKFMVEQTTPGKGKTTKIKLVKKNNGDAMFPYFLAYNRDNKLYMQTNFIGDNIFFTTKELQRINRAQAAKPTTQSVDMPAATNDFDDDIEL